MALSFAKLKRARRLGERFSFRPFDVSPEDVRSVLQAGPSGFVISAVNAVIFAISGFNTLNPMALTLWLSVALFIFVVYASKARRAGVKAPKRVSKRAVKRLAAYSVVLAAPWAFLPIAFLGQNGAREDLIIVTVCAGMSAGGAFMLYRVTLAAAAYFYTILAAVIISAALRDFGHYWPIIFYVAPFGAFLL